MEAPLASDMSVLTVLYTFGLRGDLTLLPRLYTLLVSLRARYAVQGRVITLDLGESCAPDVFPCAITGSRSTLIVFDGMGYDAANVEGVQPDDRARLVEAHTRMALLDPGEAFQGVQIAPAEVTRAQGDRLLLAPVRKGQVGVAQTQTTADGTFTLLAAQVVDLPPNTLPDPTIAGIIEFVLTEARYLAKRRGTE